MDSQTAWYFAACYGVGAAAALARMLRDGDTRDACNVIGVSFVAGFLGLGVASVAHGSGSDSGGFSSLYFGLSALLGLAGPEQTKYINAINEMILKRFGIEMEKDND